MIFNLPDIYKQYYQTELNGDLPYSLYRDLIYDFNEMVMDQLIYDQKVLPMGNALGPLSIERFMRGKITSQKSINWPLSFQRKQEIIDSGGIPYSKEHAPDGEKWFVYFDNDKVARFRWNKWRCSVKNHPLYSFTATRGSRGNKEKLKAFIRADERNILKFPAITRKK